MQQGTSDENYIQKVEIIAKICKTMGFNHILPSTNGFLMQEPSKLMYSTLEVLQDIKDGKFKDYKFDSLWFHKFGAHRWPAGGTETSWEEVSAELEKAAQNCSQGLTDNPNLSKPGSVLEFLYNSYSKKSEFLKYVNREKIDVGYLVLQKCKSEIREECRPVFERIWKNHISAQEWADEYRYWKAILEFQTWYHKNIFDLYCINNYGDPKQDKGKGNWEICGRFRRIGDTMEQFLNEREDVPTEFYRMGTTCFSWFKKWLYRETGCYLEFDPQRTEFITKESWHKYVVEQYREERKSGLKEDFEYLNCYEEMQEMQREEKELVDKWYPGYMAMKTHNLAELI